MRFAVDSTTLITATMALSVAQVGLALPIPQFGNILSSLSSVTSNIPLIGSMLGGDPNASSAPTGNTLTTVAKHLPAAGGGMEGLLATPQILGDHIKFTSDPPSALVPIPAQQNSPPRELHRQAHAALVSGQAAKAAQG